MHYFRPFGSEMTTYPVVSMVVTIHPVYILSGPTASRKRTLILKETWRLCLLAGHLLEVSVSKTVKGKVVMDMNVSYYVQCSLHQGQARKSRNLDWVYLG